MLWSEPHGGKRFTRSQDEEIVDDIKKTPHPEEAAKQLSRRTHRANPADLQFFHTLEGGPGLSGLWTVASEARGQDRQG